MPNTTEGLLLVIAGLFLLIGLVGGGFELSAAKIPPVGQKGRVGSGIVGLILLALAVRSIASRDVQSTAVAKGGSRSGAKKTSGVISGSRSSITKVDIENPETDPVIARVTYTMRFQKPDGTWVSETDFRETYKLTYLEDQKRWVILENFDYFVRS